MDCVCGRCTYCNTQVALMFRSKRLLVWEEGGGLNVAVCNAMYGD